MKKIFTSIILIIIIFSIPTNTFAVQRQGYIEELLDINFGPEEYDLELASIRDLYFADSSTRKLLVETSRVNELLKDEIIRKYRIGELGYNQTSAIVSAQKNFVYYLNDLFMYIQIKEQNPNYGEIDDYILKSYKKARIYFKKVKYLVNLK